MINQADMETELYVAPTWYAEKESLDPLPSENMAMWLNTQILSHALKKAVPYVTLKLIQQGIARPHSDETQKLGLTQQDGLPLIRQVTIGSVECRFLYCRVVVPPELYYQEQLTFDTLGERFIGETLLYNQPNVRRSAFEYALLNARHTLYQEASRYTDINHAPIEPMFYARRSIFYLPTLPLLITEVFVHEVSFS